MNELEMKLDRLVDGELSREEYSELVDSLDHHQEGWKKCALAFLEGQALRSEMRGFLHEPSRLTGDQCLLEPVTTPAQAKVQTASRPRRLRMWGQLLAIAASLLLVFWLGRGTVGPSTDPVHGPTGPNIAYHGERSQPGTEPFQHQGRLTLVVHGANGQPHEMDLPVLNGDVVDARTVLNQPISIPQEVLEILRESGHRIESHRELVPLQIDRERQVVVPVDRVRVVPVSYPMY